jgi:50S ribosomal protein L16 3-hydroxylase
VWFDPPAQAWRPSAVVLDRRTRMAYDDEHVFINGESYRARGRDAALLQRLADERALPAAAVRRASASVQHALQQWHEAGWLHVTDDAD